MKTRPLIFSSWSIPKLLDGSKTMTRRPLKGPNHNISIPEEVGDQYWVRETWGKSVTMHYLADYPSKQHAILATGIKRWKPSIFMPRLASRIILELIKPIRVERLQNISEEDAEMEGVELAPYSATPFGSPLYCYKTGFRNLWNSLYGNGSWEANPYVIVREFRRIKP